MCVNLIPYGVKKMTREDGCLKLYLFKFMTRLHSINSPKAKKFNQLSLEAHKAMEDESREETDLQKYQDFPVSFLEVSGYILCMRFLLLNRNLSSGEIRNCCLSKGNICKLSSNCFAASQLHICESYIH